MKTARIPKRDGQECRAFFRAVGKHTVGTTENDTERDSAGDRDIEGWEQLLKYTASKVIEKKLIICNRTVNLWDKDVKEAIKVRREPYARYASSKTTAGWEEYATARNKVKEMAEKKGLWRDVIY